MILSRYVIINSILGMDKSKDIFFESRDKPCKFGHTLRYVKSECCVQCHKDNARKRRLKIKEDSGLSTNTTIKVKNEMEKDKIRNRAHQLFK